MMVMRSGGGSGEAAETKSLSRRGPREGGRSKLDEIQTRPSEAELAGGLFALRVTRRGTWRLEAWRLEAWRLEAWRF